MKSLSQDLVNLLNSHSEENESNTPDFILASYLQSCLDNFNKTTNLRNDFYGVSTKLVKENVKI